MYIFECQLLKLTETDAPQVHLTEEESELPKVLLKVLFWALLKVLFKVLKKGLELVQYPKKC